MTFSTKRRDVVLGVGVVVVAIISCSCLKFESIVFDAEWQWKALTNTLKRRRVCIFLASVSRRRTIDVQDYDDGAGDDNGVRPSTGAPAASDSLALIVDYRTILLVPATREVTAGNRCRCSGGPPGTRPGEQQLGGEHHPCSRRPLASSRTSVFSLALSLSLSLLSSSVNLLSTVACLLQQQPLCKLKVSQTVLGFHVVDWVICDEHT